MNLTEGIKNMREMMTLTNQTWSLIREALISEPAVMLENQLIDALTSF